MKHELKLEGAIEANETIALMRLASITLAIRKIAEGALMMITLCQSYHQKGHRISPKFQLLLIKEYQRLKEDENHHLQLEWNLQRMLAKVNYHIHTDAIKEKLIPAQLTKAQINFVYANEADILNMALFDIEMAKKYSAREFHFIGVRRL